MAAPLVSLRRLPRPIMPTALVLGAAMLLTGPVACETEPADPDPSTISTDPPPGADILPREITPMAVISETRQGVNFTDQWVGEQGWDGEVVSVKRSGGMTRFSVRMHAATAVGGDFWVVCESPEGDEVEEGTLVRFRGRIREIEFTSNAMLSGDKIHLDHVKVL